MQSSVLNFLIILFLIAACQNVNYTPIEDFVKSEYPGVWSLQFGEPEQLNLLNATGIMPRAEALKNKTPEDFPLESSEIKLKLINGKTYIRLPLEKGEQIYGLGLNYKTINQRNRIMRLHVDHYGGRDNGRTHAPVPFFVSSRGYGVLVNSARYIDVYAGTGVRLDSKNLPRAKDRTTDETWSPQPYSDNFEMLIPAEGVELILFSGKNVMDVVSRFNLYCGGGFIPPKWGLGFWHRVPTRYSSEQVEQEVAEFRKMNFPLDVVGLEPGWHSRAYPCSFEWDKSRYPDPESFVRNMQEQDIQLNLWCNPYISPDAALYEKLKPYYGSHTVWLGAVPDLTIPAARDIFGEHISRHQLDLGISGYKIDEVDGYDFWLWPDVAEFPSGYEAEQLRQVYGNLSMKMIYDQFRERNTRTYGLVRAANAGSVSLPFVLYNDQYTHRDYITGLVNSGFTGVLWTPEVRSGHSPEDWVRRIQTTCISSLAMINAWASETKPWEYPEVYKACQEAALLRMQLLPYLYSTFAQYYLEGKPPFRAMEMDPDFSYEVKKIRERLDGTNNPYETIKIGEIKDQYMFGDNILVAPLFEGEQVRDVVFPKGRWYDFYSGKLVGDGDVVTIKGKLEQIPLFVRDGGIVPMIEAHHQTKAWIDGLPLQVRVYGKKDGNFHMYDDDGKTFNYENGTYSIKELSITSGKTVISDTYTNNDWTYSGIEWKFMSTD